MRDFVRQALYAQAAGVALSLKAWNKFSHEEQGTWLAAREALALAREQAGVREGGAGPTRGDHGAMRQFLEERPARSRERGA